MSDTRIFRVTRASGRVQYCTIRAVTGMFRSTIYGAGGHTVSRAEATNEDATEGWTDVTLAFQFPAGQDRAGCRRHRAYTGARKPSYRWYSDRLCTCWEIYGELHPGYPSHSDYCDKPASDPASCACASAAKLIG